MKLELILALALMNLSIGERAQRSTVLTDESKRILEQFDFSNFDKQEALNYIDRQRYDNQIRGKRSRVKMRRNPRVESCNVHEETNREYSYGSDDWRQGYSNFPWLSSNDSLSVRKFMPQCRARKLVDVEDRLKRGHRHKKKSKIKQSQLKEVKNEEVSSHDFEDYDEDEAEEERYLKRMKKKKKKKKKRHYWGKWSKWSPCSVTCGRGRKIRWRKCIVKNCTNGELEMGEKTCQLPACNLLSKLLADIKKNIKLGSNLLGPPTPCS